MIYIKIITFFILALMKFTNALAIEKIDSQQHDLKDSGIVKERLAVQPSLSENKEALKKIDLSKFTESPTEIFLKRLSNKEYLLELTKCLQNMASNTQLFKYPKQSDFFELNVLITCSTSMDNDEKQYWFDVFPELKPEEIERLYEILFTEMKWRNYKSE